MHARARARETETGSEVESARVNRTAKANERDLHNIASRVALCPELFELAVRVVDVAF